MLHLHTHSVYSYKNSTASVKDIMNESKRQGEKSFCITDYGSLTSFVKALSEAEKNDMKFIPGCEFLVKPEQDVYTYEIENKISYYKKEMRLKRTTAEMYEEYDKKVKKLENIHSVGEHSIVLLAKNKKGFENLVNIFNEETQEDENSQFLATNESIFNNSEGLIVLSGGFNGSIMYYIRNNRIDKAEELIVEFKEKFGDNFYAQIEYQSRREIEGELNEIDSFNKLIELANKHNVKFVCTNDVTYVKESERAYYRLYKNVMSAERLKFDSDHHWMMDEETLKTRLNSVYPNDVVESGLKNVKEIENSCEIIKAPKANNLIDTSEQLTKMCKEGWERLRKGTDREQESKERYEFELEVINGKNFSQYFIKVLNIIQLAKELGILIGPGRGSGCGSEICYLIGITYVDPLKYGLFFERFLNPERNGFPDIDIDMASVPLGNNIDAESEEEDEEGVSENSASRNILVDNLIKRGYFNFSGFIQNEVTASSLVLFKNLAKYYDIPFYEANKISTDDKFKELLSQKPDKKTKKPWKYNHWLKEACNDFNLDWEDVWDQIDDRMQFCYDLAGIPNNTSIAASGVIMADDIPILPKHNGILGFNGVDLESWGYIKYDLLSINTLNAIQHFEGLDFNWNDTEDPKVWDTICNGDLDFVFQLAGGVPRQMCTQGQPRSIERLAEINAINRPGPLNLELNKIWVDVQNGTHKFEGEDAILADILKRRFGKTHSGLVVYQEDVMGICQEGAGFSLAEADGIRKAMGKKIQELMDSYKPKFINGWKRLGTPGDPEIIWGKLEDFSKYGFNKSHAVAYSIIGYHTAKLWTYHRDEFLEWMLNHDTKKRYQEAINKCKELGFKFEYPTIYDMSETKFRIENETVHIPVSAAKSYDSYVEFLFGETSDLTNLIYRGVCDKLSKDRLALAELATTILPKLKETALWMEPEGKKFTKLTQILDGLMTCGAIVDYKKEGNNIRVFVKRGRGNPSQVLFHANNSDYVKVNLVKLDLKMFGSVRKGVISDLPYINTTAIERTLETLKEKYYKDGKGKYAFKAMQDKLKEYMKDYFSTPFRSTYHDIYAILEDKVEFQRSTKLILNFNDRQEILYATKTEHIKKLRTMSKNCLVKMTLIYSPYVARRTEKFIYDFDILEIEEIKVDE